jgi:hypothetical protein
MDAEPSTLAAYLIDGAAPAERPRLPTTEPSGPLANRFGPRS